MKNTRTLESIKPLMSITEYHAKQLPDSKMEVRVEYGVTRKRIFTGIVTKEQWRKFLNDYNNCVDSFWEMGED